MKQVKVLGSGCKKCTRTVEIIQTVASECGVDVNVVKETSPEAMMRYGVMSTPAVIVDDVLVHSGSVPDRQKVEAWLK